MKATFNCDWNHRFHGYFAHYPRLRHYYYYYYHNELTWRFFTPSKGNIHLFQLLKSLSYVGTISLVSGHSRRSSFVCPQYPLRPGLNGVELLPTGSYRNSLSANLEKVLRSYPSWRHIDTVQMTFNCHFVADWISVSVSSSVCTLGLQSYTDNNKNRSSAFVLNNPS